MNTIRHTLLSALLAAGTLAGTLAPAQAGILEYQGVTFTTSWSGKVLTLEIDAAHPGGDWAAATSIGALQLKDLGSFGSVSLLSAPGGAANWALSSNELNAKGCGGGAHGGASLCLSGEHVALTDDMVFRFGFDGGATDFSSPQVKVNLFGDAGARKVGSLMSQNIPLAAVPEPQSYALMFGGLAVMWTMGRRRRAERF